jgi:hypothetical protein
MQTKPQFPTLCSACSSTHSRRQLLCLKPVAFTVVHRVCPTLCAPQLLHAAKHAGSFSSHVSVSTSQTHRASCCLSDAANTHEKASRSLQTVMHQ